MGYNSITQHKNLAWYLPRPKKDLYRGGMPLYCEEWLLELAEDILGRSVSVLNVFCGTNKAGMRVDLNPFVVEKAGRGLGLMKLDYVGDAHKLSEAIKDKKFDVILADPPYSDKESKKLWPDVKLPKLNYKKWTAECEKLLVDDGLLIVYHRMLMPNPNREKFLCIKRVTVLNRVWHVPRVAMFFRKKHSEDAGLKLA
jgi:hypothetical protein